MADITIDPADLAPQQDIQIDPMDLAPQAKADIDISPEDLAPKVQIGSPLTKQDIEAARKPTKAGLIEGFQRGVLPKGQETLLTYVPFSSGAEAAGIAKNVYDASQRLKENPYNAADQKLVLDFIKSNNQMPE